MQAQGVLYKVVVQTVLMYGGERWVFTGSLLTVIEGFHRQVVRRILGNRNGHQCKNTWRLQGCVPSNNTFIGGRPPLRCKF